MKKKAKIFIGFIFILACLSSVLIFSGCGSKKNQKVQVEMENGDTFVIELYPEFAPKTVDNFVKLVNEGFYDGLTFHRVIDGFMAQGGGFDANGVEKPSDSIYGEFANNGYTKNTLKHTRGVVSMARIGNMNDSASSEFFIMYNSAPGLDGDYAAFGKVTEGMDVVDKFLKVERTAGADGNISTPVTPIIIKKMTVVK